MCIRDRLAAHARGFGCDDAGAAEYGNRPLRKVAEVADRGRNDIKPGCEAAHCGAGLRGLHIIELLNRICVDPLRCALLHSNITGGPYPGP